MRVLGKEKDLGAVESPCVLPDPTVVLEGKRVLCVQLQLVDLDPSQHVDDAHEGLKRVDAIPGYVEHDAAIGQQRPVCDFQLIDRGAYPALRAPIPSGGLKELQEGLVPSEQAFLVVARYHYRVVPGRQLVRLVREEQFGKSFGFSFADVQDLQLDKKLILLIPRATCRQRMLDVVTTKEQLDVSRRSSLHVLVEARRRVLQALRLLRPKDAHRRAHHLERRTIEEFDALWLGEEGGNAPDCLLRHDTAH
mmetsp:Transcript_2246/g.6824  ORF Transcript_2246/g.6824 Transcript_2246/m.6824 type:complete len:250 (-) Transcript_2246:97-846(-)